MTGRIAVIPARGGSKRIPRKNIRSFAGRPMIGYAVDAALASNLFDHIVVSTDDAEIADVARAAGAKVPFVRPGELSDDLTGTIPVVRHAVQWQCATGRAANQVCCIYATAPFLESEDLRRGLELLERSGADFAFSLTRYPFPIQRALRVDTQGRVSMFQPEHFETRSQDLKEAWHDAGQFYWGRATAWCAAQTLFGPASVAVPIPVHRVQDIDSEEDWIRAEWMFGAMRAAK